MDELNKTEEGRKYLADCKRYETTDADLDHLESKFKVNKKEV